ncbi:F-box domain containing protein [Hordeum vulgare]|nr:F-box domain containing protein [Hordeum vulgare]
MGYKLKLWALELDAETWVLRKTVNIQEILASLLTRPSPKTEPHFNHMPRVKIIGVAEEDDALFLSIMVGIFVLCVESMELTKPG